MGRIIPYILENKKCLKPPTSNSSCVLDCVSIIPFLIQYDTIIQPHTHFAESPSTPRRDFSRPRPSHGPADPEPLQPENICVLHKKTRILWGKAICPETKS